MLANVSSQHKDHEATSSQALGTNLRTSIFDNIWLFQSSRDVLPVGPSNSVAHNMHILYNSPHHAFKLVDIPPHLFTFRYFPLWQTLSQQIPVRLKGTGDTDEHWHRRSTALGNVECVRVTRLGTGTFCQSHCFHRLRADFDWQILAKLAKTDPDSQAGSSGWDTVNYKDSQGTVIML